MIMKIDFVKKIKDLYNKLFSYVTLKCFICGKHFKVKEKDVRNFNYFLSQGMSAEDIANKVNIRCPNSKCKSTKWIISNRADALRIKFLNLGIITIIFSKLMDLLGFVLAQIYFKFLIFIKDWYYDFRGVVTRGLPVIMLLIIIWYSKFYIFKEIELYYLVLFVLGTYLSVNLAIKWRK